MHSIDICYLYPELTNSYGDRGNIFTLQKRCEWRNIDVNIHNISLKDNFDPNRFDIVFFGSSQGYEKQIILGDFKAVKANAVKEAVENNVVFLCIGGGYQLMGKYLETTDGTKLECPGILDIYTIDSNKRMTGHLIFKCNFPASGSKGSSVGNKEPDDISSDISVVSFENHSGKTYLGSGVSPLGKVLCGCGNNGEDGYEGAVYKNVYCSYGHGSLLPRNPLLADYLITLAMKRKYIDFDTLQPLDDWLENQAHLSVLK
ncbi:MAG TPA: glutamine amidotransferase [Clostridiales bacterium]|nr:glutamine amidotransferase [Clostridiales bacterium]